MVKRSHCEICDVVLGKSPNTIWNNLVTENLDMEFCKNCNPKVENGVIAIIHNLKEEMELKH